MATSGEDAFAWLVPILERKRPDGSHYYSNEDVAAFIPAALLTLGIGDVVLPHAISELVVAFAEDAGVRPGMSKKATEKKLKAHLAKHPLNPELVFEFKRGLREELASSTAKELGERLNGALIGRASGLSPGPKLGQTPPAGTIKGGPLARFSVGRLVEPQAETRLRGPRDGSKRRPGRGG